MASNKYTQQPAATFGASNPIVRMVIAERCYISNAASGTFVNYDAESVVKLNGADPNLPAASSWSDLGIVQNSQVQISYNKEIKYIETGIEKIRRGAYVAGKTAQATFTLEQFDIKLLEHLTGLTGTAITGGKKIHLGQDDLVRKSLLFVGSNRIDAAEIQTFCKDCAVSFQMQTQDDSRVLQVTADLFAFTPSGQSTDAFFTMFMFAA